MTLHDSEELDDDLGGRTDQDLTLASLLSLFSCQRMSMSISGAVAYVVDGVERIVEDGSLDHFDGLTGDSLWRRRLRYLRVRG